MSGADVITALVGAALIMGGVMLAMACLWWRLGTSPSARWWVRREPVEHMTSFANSEGVALVLAPVAAQLLVATGALLLAIPFLLPVSGWLLAVLAAAALAQFAILVGARFATAYRKVLPMWAYPAWLRPARRHDAQILRGRS